MEPTGQHYATAVKAVSPHITTWQQFRSFTDGRPGKLLKRLHLFPNSILVTGCQRSGTTMLSEIFLGSEGVVDFRFGKDSELDGALILAGLVEHEPAGRYCFQTTYLNEHYEEYFEQSGFRMVWLLRNPASVICSMLYNWKSDALERLFAGCGVTAISGIDRLQFRLLGAHSLSLLKRACWAYNGKMRQLFQLRRALNPAALAVLDYDELVVRKAALLPRLYSFLDLAYRAEYPDQIRTGSLNKKSRLSEAQSAIVEQTCGPVYRQASALKTISISV
ncbi:MAG: hypothetical protein ACE15E_13115 [Acidobacteriota bacterium]